ncbi:MAG: hemerythrin family protein [Gammaproteobacteria bacterium]|nr:hemerythrin family protein [Gammaproteobacteria bacterium]
MIDTTLDWQERYALGIPAVDDAHLKLIRMINHLVICIVEGTDRASISASLGDILSATSAHFALEEKIMRDSHYDRYFEHKADHDRLLDQLRDMMDDYGVHGRLEPAQLVRVLDEWFSEHIRSHDARLHRLVELPGSPAA